MALQVGFLDAFTVLLAGELGARHFDVRDDALSLDRAAVGREIQGGGQLQRAVVVQRQYGLYRTLAEAVGAHQYRAFVILQRTGDDLRSRGAAAIDQHHQRYAFAGVGRVGVETQFGIGQAAFGVDDQAALEEVVGDFHGCLQHAARVVAQVHDQAAQFLVAVVLAQFGQRLADLFAGIDLELRDTQIAVAVFEHLALHAAHLDHRAGQGQVERATAITHQRQLDRATGLAAHLVHGFHHRQTLGRLAVDLDDQVAGLDAGLRCRRIVDGRDHLDEAILHADLDAQAAELAAGAFLQFGEGFRLEVGRVRVEVAEHALDGILQQGLVAHRLDVGCLDAVHHLGEGAQIIQRQRSLAACRRCRRGGRLGGVQGWSAEQQPEGQGQAGGAEAMRHEDNS